MQNNLGLKAKTKYGIGTIKAVTLRAFEPVYYMVKLKRPVKRIYENFIDNKTFWVKPEGVVVINDNN